MTSSFGGFLGVCVDVVTIMSAVGTFVAGILGYPLGVIAAVAALGLLRGFWYLWVRKSSPPGKAPIVPVAAPVEPAAMTAYGNSSIELDRSPVLNYPRVGETHGTSRIKLTRSPISK